MLINEQQIHQNEHYFVKKKGACIIKKRPK